MKNRILTFTILLVTWFSTGNRLCAQQQGINDSACENNDFQLLMEKIRQDFAINPPAEEIEEALATYNEADGSFTDVDYASIQRTNWHRLHMWTVSMTLHSLIPRPKINTIKMKNYSPG